MDIKEIKGETTYTLTLTGKQLQMLRYLAKLALAPGPCRPRWSAGSFIQATDNTEAAKLDVDWSIHF